MNMKLRKIPFSPPDMTEAEAKEVRDAILSGWITTGPRTKKLEAQISEYVHTNKTVCLNSATAAMEMVLHLLGVGPGDEVIVPAYTYTAIASVVQHVGEKVVFVDSQKDSVEMDYDLLEQPITKPQGVCIRYFCPKPGVLKSISNTEVLDDPRVYEWEIYYKEGDIIPEVTSSLCRSGHVIVTEETPQKAIELAEQLIEEVKFKIL